MLKKVTCALLAGLLLMSAASCSKSSRNSSRSNSGNNSNSTTTHRTDERTDDSAAAKDNKSQDTIRYKTTSVSEFRSAIHDLYGDDALIENNAAGEYWYIPVEKDNWKNPCEGIQFYNHIERYKYWIFAYDNAADAKNAFEGFYNSKVDEVDAQNYEGSSKYAYSGNEGYILFNGSQQGRYYEYGGLFFKDNTVVYVMAKEDKTSLRNEVDKFLKTIGYPLPSDYL